jgi:two-component system response regulator AtoC
MMASVSDRSRQTPNDATESLDLLSDASELRLLVSAANGDRSYPFGSKSKLVLGRASDCDVVLLDSAVSRRHVAIVLSGVPYLEDLGSRNGTVLFGRTLRAGDRSPLPVGTAFSVGAATVVLQRRSPTPTTSNHPVIEDPAVRAIYDLLDVIGPSPLSVLVLGETGTGKEVFANAVHARSPRARRTFLPVNCAALSDTLLESELFGHEKGAFTGAMQAKTGLFEAADGGTVFLDEIGELGVATQAKLLRVLETGEVTRLGSVKPIHVDVRFVAATNRELDAFVEAGRFRRDLLYRLNGFTVTLPPLRDRPLDILPLARHFVARAAARLERAAPTLSEAAQEALVAYPWPGNVRELRHVIERAASTCRGAAVIAPEHLALPSKGPSKAEPANVTTPTDPPPDVHEKVVALTKERILAALQRTTFNQTEACKLLGVSRRTLINKIVLYGIRRPRKGG